MAQRGSRRQSHFLLKGAFSLGTLRGELPRNDVVTALPSRNIIPAVVPQFSRADNPPQKS